MAKLSLRTASIACLLAWAAVWMLFLAMRFSRLDITQIPGVGFVVVTALAIALLTPLLAIGLAAAALIRQPRLLPNWLTLASAIAVFCGQALLFVTSHFM